MDHDQERLPSEEDEGLAEGDETGDRSTQYGRDVRTMRLMKGWSQVDLARLAGVHKDTIANIESGRTEVADADVHVALGTAFKLLPRARAHFDKVWQACVDARDGRLELRRHWRVRPSVSTATPPRDAHGAADVMSNVGRRLTADASGDDVPPRDHGAGEQNPSADAPREGTHRATTQPQPSAELAPSPESPERHTEVGPTLNAPNAPSSSNDVGSLAPRALLPAGQDGNAGAPGGSSRTVSAGSEGKIDVLVQSRKADGSASRGQRPQEDPLSASRTALRELAPGVMVDPNAYYSIGDRCLALEGLPYGEVLYSLHLMVDESARSVHGAGSGDMRRFLNAVHSIWFLSGWGDPKRVNPRSIISEDKLRAIEQGTCVDVHPFLHAAFRAVFALYLHNPEREDDDPALAYFLWAFDEAYRRLPGLPLRAEFDTWASKRDLPHGQFPPAGRNALLSGVVRPANLLPPAKPGPWLRLDRDRYRRESKAWRAWWDAEIKRNDGRRATPEELKELGIE